MLTTDRRIRIQAVVSRSGLDMDRMGRRIAIQSVVSLFKPSYRYPRRRIDTTGRPGGSQGFLTGVHQSSPGERLKPPSRVTSRQPAPAADAAM